MFKATGCFSGLVTFGSLLVAGLVLAPMAAFAQNNNDPYIWLEEPLAPAAVSWADAQTKLALSALESDARYAPLEKEIRAVASSPARLPSLTYQAGKVFSFWQDAAHVHGIYRQTTLAELKAGKENWVTLLDLDKLAQDEKTNWVYKSVTCLEPVDELCLVSLSPDGGDAVVVREFNLKTRAFVPTGFVLPVAKSTVSWVDADNILVATDFGPGSLTKAGYPGILKAWHRGAALENAKTILQAQPGDLSVSSATVRDGKASFVVIARNIDFYLNETYVYSPKAALVKLPFPLDASISAGGGGYLFATLKSPWAFRGKSFPTGSLVSLPLGGLATASPEAVFLPTKTAFLGDWQISRDALYLSVLDNVRGKLVRAKHSATGWSKKPIDVPPMGSLSLGISGEDTSGLLFEFESFLVPRSIMVLAADSLTPKTLKSSPAFFDASPYFTEQYEATSRDGTKVPYFVVHRKDWKLDGKNPTLQNGYGGFEISETPYYSGVVGKAWLEKGGVYVVANIRGGGEFGPDWHTTALKEHRQRAYDDFIAVSEDLIARKVTTPAHLGILGGSNGGLLVGVTMVERPELYNAVVCEVPLLDMIRFPLIAAGYSWEAEYGDPNVPAERAAILKYSPYQNVRAGVKYPKVFFMTSRTDDRVGSAHARKMAAKMQGFGDDLLFFEDPEGGHSGADSIEERVHSSSLSYTYLYQQLF
jgi:prolyl oligopeptidase